MPIRRDLVIASVGLLIVLLVACSGQSLQEVTARARTATASVQSYRWEGSTELYSNGETVASYRSEGEFAAPDRYRVKVGSDNGSWAECIQIGDQRYLRTSDDASWRGGESNESCAVVPLAEELQLLEYLTALQPLPDEEIDGVDCIHYRGAVDVEVLVEEQEMELAPEALEQMRRQTIEIELWVGRSDSLIRQITSDGRLPESERGTDEEKWATQRSTTRYYDFNEPIVIEPPAGPSSRSAD